MPLEDQNAPQGAEQTVVESTPAAPEPSLRDSLEAAFKEHKEPSEKPVAKQQDGSPDKATQTAQERARDETGKFAKAEAKAAQEAAPEAAKAQEQAVKTEQQPQTEQTAQPTVIAAPRGWPVAAKAAFDTLPDVVKQAVAEREANIDKGFAKYSGLDRHVQEFERNGVKLADAVDRYRAAEQDLTNDPVGGFARLANVMGIDPIQLAQAWLGQQQDPNNSNGQAVPPAVQNHIRQLEQRLSRFENQITGERQSKAMSEAEKFLSDPANKYADNVIGDMEQIIKVARASGQEVSLKDAYDRACYASPEIRNLLIEDQFKARTKAEQDKAAQAASKAKGSALSVTGSPVAGVSASGTSNRSLREDLEEAFASSRGRA